MKKLLITAVVLAIIAGSTALVALHYTNTTQKKRQADTAVIQKQLSDLDVKIKGLETSTNKLVKENKTLRAECQKGLEAYNALTPSIKAKTAAPVCEAQ